MKKIISILLPSILITCLFLSCPIGLSQDFSQIPSDLMRTFYINYESGIGTATFSLSGINVVRGDETDFGEDTSRYLKYYQNAYEFDTSTLIDQGYSLSTTYVQEESSHPVLTLICTKNNSDTLKYIFNIYSNDINIYKSVNGVLLGDDINESGNYITYLTWDED